MMTNLMTKLLHSEYIYDDDRFFDFFNFYKSYSNSHLAERTIGGKLENIPLYKNAIRPSQDEIFKSRLEKTNNPRLRLHLKIYEATFEFC